LPLELWPLRYDRLRLFRNVLVHPSQEMRDPEGAFFRGGPDWPRFGTQILARHCRGAIPRPIDTKPLPARSEWPYFDPQFLPLFWPQLGIDPRLSPQDRQRAIAGLAETYAPLPHQGVDAVDAGIWCGPISLHFGEMTSVFGMRIAGSTRADGVTPLVFSLPPFRHLEPPRFFWDMIDHFGVDRGRVLLIRTPTRFDRLYVIPQAERLYGGGPHPRHLLMMDEMTGGSAIDRDVDCVFVSRARLAEGRFAGESYIDETLAAAGVTVFHPETADLPAQLRLYRRARMLIFSEGSALHALQLLGHLDCEVIVLVRRPGNRIAAASLRPRTHSLRYLAAARGLVYGLTPSGHPVRCAGISVLDERPFVSGLKSAGIDLTSLWDAKAYAARRNVDIEAWIAQRQTADRHPADQAFVERRMGSLSLQV
jgi:hypothetical protein